MPLSSSFFSVSWELSIGLSQVKVKHGMLGKAGHTKIGQIG